MNQPITINIHQIHLPNDETELMETLLLGTNNVPVKLMSTLTSDHVGMDSNELLITDSIRF
jgi:hypothetical protein